MNKIWKNTSLIKKVERKDQRGVNWWLRLHSPNAGGMGLIPGQETKISQATSHGQKEKKKKRGRIRKEITTKVKITVVILCYFHIIIQIFLVSPALFLLCFGELKETSSMHTWEKI